MDVSVCAAVCQRWRPVTHTLTNKPKKDWCGGWWSVWGGEGRGSRVMECWMEGGRRVMSVCSQCKWHLSSSDRLSLSRCNGDPVREPSPSALSPEPSSTHSYSPSLHPLTIPRVYLFSAEICCKLLTFWCLSIHPFFCIIFNQSSPFSIRLLIFCKAVYSALQLREEEERRRRNKKREIRKEGESMSKRISIFPPPLGSSEWFFFLFESDSEYSA